MSRVVWFAVVPTVLASTPLRAQVCAGLASFHDRPIQVGGGAAFSKNGRSLGGFLGAGGPRTFGDLAFGTTHIDAYDASGFTLSAEAGYQISLDKKGVVQLCPGAGVGLLIGPKNINGLFDYSETDIRAGALLGGVVARTAQVDVVPTGLLEFVHAHGKLQGPSSSSSQSQSFGLVGLGVGLVFRNRVSIRPDISIPFGISGGSTSFGITVAVNVQGGW